MEWNLSSVRRRPEALPPGALYEQMEPAYERLYYPLGEPLLLQTNDRALLEPLEETFGRFEPPETGAANNNPLLIRLYVHDVRPSGAASDEHPEPIVRTQGHLLYVTMGAENAAVADLVQGTAFGFLTPQVAHNPAVVRYFFLEMLGLTLVAAGRQFIPIHAAAVVRSGLSVLLRGDSGRGKTTLAFACARRGYQVLAEDVVFAKARSNGIELWGAPWKFHLLPDSVNLFPELKGLHPKLQMNREWKLEVELEKLYPGSTTVRAGPGPLVFLARRPAEACTWIEPLPPAGQPPDLGIVWPYWVGWTEEMDRQLPCLWQCGVYRLWMNGSPDAAVDALDALLENLA